MNETLILIAENKIKDKSLTSQEAKKRIEKLDEDYGSMLRWCFINLHDLNSYESRNFVLNKIQKILDNKLRVHSISMNSSDDLLLEFFVSIYNDQNYLDIRLLNKISDIQAKLVKCFFPDEWPTAFDTDEEIGVLNLSDPAFYNFLKSFGWHAQKNQEIVNNMIEDQFSLSNLLNRISEAVMQDSFDAKQSYLNSFSWVDFHLLIEYPCFYFILDEFVHIPNPKTASSLLSIIFKEKMNEEERINLISNFNLFAKFSKYLKTFSTIDSKSFDGFINLICNIFEPINNSEFISSFFPIFMETFIRLVNTEKYQKTNYTLNNFFSQIISKEIIDFSSMKEIYYPMLIDVFENPKDRINLNLSLIFDLLFRSISDEAQLVSEVHYLLIKLKNTLINFPSELSKFKYCFIILNEFSLFLHKNLSKIIIGEILDFFSFLLDFKPTEELLSDEHFLLCLKSYSDIFIQMISYYSNSKKKIAEIKEFAASIFIQQFQCTELGVDIFIDSMYQLSKLKDLNIVKLENINDIVIFLLTSLRKELFDIAASLLEQAPNGVVGMIKNKSTEIITARDPASITPSELQVLVLLFNMNENQRQENDKKGDDDDDTIKNFSGFLFVSPENQDCFEFFNQVFIEFINGNAEEDGNESNENENDDENLVSNTKFESIDDFYDYIAMMVFLFGYKAFPIYSNEIFDNQKNQNILLIASILSILSTKFKPVDITNIPITSEIEETINFLIDYSQYLIKFLFISVEKNIRESSSQPLDELSNFSSYYSEFTKYIVHFAPIMPSEIFQQFLSIMEQLFKIPILFSDAFHVFFNYIISMEDFSLFEIIYPSSLELLIKFLSKPKMFPTDFLKCVIEILTFHYKIYQKDIEWGSEIIAPAGSLLNKFGSKFKFSDYKVLLQSDKNQLFTEIGKVINIFFNSK